MVVAAITLYHFRHVKRKPSVSHELAPLLLPGMLFLHIPDERDHHSEF
jgi:hypothetical protein